MIRAEFNQPRDLECGIYVQEIWFAMYGTYLAEPGAGITVDGPGEQGWLAPEMAVEPANN